MSAPAPHAHEPLRFAYSVPNVSGGLAVSKIEQPTALEFLQHLEDVEYFGTEVLPLVRELGAAELERV